MKSNSQTHLHRLIPPWFTGALSGMLFFSLCIAVWVHLDSLDYQTIDSGPVKGDAIVVLGGGIHRAERASDLFMANDAPMILITGTGDWFTNFNVLKNRGVPIDRILIEKCAINTRNNARLTVPLLRQIHAHRVILVTSSYHSRRALACFRHEAPDLQFFSRPSYRYCGDSNGPGVKVEQRNQELEQIKYFWYLVRYGIWSF